MTRRSPPSHAPFEPEFVEALTDLFERKVTFNGIIGLEVVSIAADRATGRIAMRPELVGNFGYRRLHGGVISAGLDAMAGLAVMSALGARHRSDTVAQRLARFERIGTIDLRVDYLYPGIGDRFELSAEVMRIGSRVASVRMEFRGADGALLATGTAAYIVS